MGLTSWVANAGSSALGYIVPFLFVLTIVVFFHEFGHFIVARWCGVKVKVFSVGFGPELIGFNDRKGTRWRVSAVPLGGYVRFLGDEGEASTPDRAAIEALPAEERALTFAAKPVWARAAIVAAGPIANFVLAIVIFTGIFATFGQQTITPRIDGIVAGSAAEKAGLKAGDVVVSIDGGAVDSFSDLQRIVGFAAGQPLSIVVRRGGGNHNHAPTPEL
jgi:regulator of sigma E protease